MTAIQDLPLSTIHSLIKHSVEKEQEKYIWEMWLARYQWMDKDNFISFNDFKKNLLKPTVQHSNKSLEEIEEEMMKVVKAYEGQVK